MSGDDTGQTVAVGALSKLLLLTDTRIQQLAKQGVIVKAGRGEYRLVPSIQGYVKFLQKAAQGGGGDDVNSNDLPKHKTRLYKARADKAEVEAALIQGTAHDATSVEKVWGDAIANVRQKLLALPTTLAAQLDGVDSTAERQEIIKDGVHDALKELVEYRPEVLTGEYVKSHGDDEMPPEDEDEDEDEQAE